MDWKTIGIIALPVAALAAWYVADRVWFAEPTAVAFAHEGVLVMDAPGLEPNMWHLAYEESGTEHAAPLLFGGESRCGPEGMHDICDISFLQGERVRVEGVWEGEAIRIATLTYLHMQPPQEDGTTIRLYFYDPERDTDASGDILCTRQGLVSVERTIPQTITPLTDAIRLLLRGGISDEEREQGIQSEFPLPGVALERAVIQNGVATLTFADPEGATGGGSCRIAILWAQIEATAQQFSTVSEVRFEPEELFQP